MEKTSGALALLLALALGIPVAAPAAASSERKIDEDHPGYATYRRYCSNCHGVFADGQGPVAPILEIPPADLTRLWAKYGDPLRKDEIAAYIDGRARVASHGPGEMPVWGERLYEYLPEDDTEDVEVKNWARSVLIMRIVDYLEAVQHERPAEAD